MFTEGKFFMAKTVERTLSDGRKVQVKDVYKEYQGGPSITRMQELEGPKYPLILSLICFTVFALSVIFMKAREYNLYLKALFGLSTLSFFIFVVWSYFDIQNYPALTMRSNPYLLMLTITSLFFVIMFCVMSWKYESFLELLPEAKVLDELSYKNILFAFPFQTLLLITGAIWAYYAWGRSWGWDPKETWALITWFAYLIYLHGKLLMRWTPTTLAILSLIGMGLMIFAFLGVNLVLSGLHSYGAA